MSDAERNETIGRHSRKSRGRAALTFEDGGRALEASERSLLCPGLDGRPDAASGTTAISRIIMSIRTSTPPTCASTPADFCARLRGDLGEARAYVMDRDQIVERARGRLPSRCHRAAHRRRAA